MTLPRISVLGWLAVLIAFALGFLVCGLVAEWEIVRKSFFSVKITDVIQILVTVVVAIVFTYLLGKRTSNEFHRKDILQNVASRFQKNVDSAFKIGVKYVDGPSNDLKTRVLAELKNASVSLFHLIELRKASKLDEDHYPVIPVKSAFLEFKKSLTDSPFGNMNVVFTEGQKALFSEKYQNLGFKIHAFKIRLYE